MNWIVAFLNERFDLDLVASAASTTDTLTTSGSFLAEINVLVCIVLQFIGYQLRFFLCKDIPIPGFYRLKTAGSENKEERRKINEAEIHNYDLLHKCLLDFIFHGFGFAGSKSQVDADNSSISADNV